MKRNGCEVFNLGTGRGCSVLELVKAGRISIDENEQITLAHGRVRKTDEVQEWN